MRGGLGGPRRLSARLRRSMSTHRGSLGKRSFDAGGSVDPDEPVADVAVRILRTRLEGVWRNLRAACGPKHEPERVHQLRVATRRALAAITAFEGLMPRKPREWFVKRLRKVRRAAGNARDLDVLTDRLARDEEAIGSATAARRRLVAMLARQRSASRRPIQVVREELSAADWPGRVERLLERIAAEPTRRSFRRYARRRFEPLLRRFFARADRRLRDAEEIHRLRIEGKRLRYSLEIFASVFPARVRVKCEKALAKLQESLGEFTDHAAAADRLRRWSREDSVAAERATISALRKAEARRADEARRQFTKWWNPTRRRALRRRFERTLRRGSA